MKRIYIIAILSVFGLYGCASTGVIPMGKQSYFIAKKDGMPGMGVSYEVKAEVYQEANEFCEKKNQVVETIDIKVTPAGLAKVGSTELTFKCIDKTVK